MLSIPILYNNMKLKVANVFLIYLFVINKLSKIRTYTQQFYIWQLKLFAYKIVQLEKKKTRHKKHLYEETHVSFNQRKKEIISPIF